MFAKLADKLLDFIWDVTEPVSGPCPVCAFYRGLCLGLFAGIVAFLLVLP